MLSARVGVFVFLIVTFRTKRKPEGGNHTRAFENGLELGRFHAGVPKLAAPEGRQIRHQQRVRIFGQLAHVTTDCLFVHAFYLFYLFTFFNGKFSASSRWAASGELATFKIEFLPPNGLGTVSLASGSGIQRPSTTRQYS